MIIEELLMNIVFGRVKPGRYACRLKTLQGVEDDYELHKGISRVDGWPLDAYFEMSEAFPENLKLEDFVFNTNNVLVISDKFLNFLDQKHLKNNEVLPVKIINHKGRVVKEKYYILHQLILQNCIDVDNSVVTKNKINPNRFISIKKLVINEKQIESDVSIFRMERYPSLAIFEKDLSENIVQAGFTGIIFGEIADWKGK